MEGKNQNLVKIGNHIRKLRGSKGLSQEAFADTAGLDRSYVGGIERGERNIASINLIRIAKALDVEVGTLFPPIKQLTD